MPTPLETIRHSTAHLMAAAIQKLWPEAKFGVGPVVEDGFYYDIELNHTLTPEDLKKIEKGMRSLQAKDILFERQEIALDEAIKLFSKAQQPYKVELLNDLKRHGTTVASEIFGGTESNAKKENKVKTVSIYTTGDFVDLCRGPHVKSTKEIPSFKLLKLAGAYWRGDEKNNMLQRVYGTAFEKENELKEYLHMLEEAKKRDHKLLGPKLDLFVFSDLVGPGLPLWTPQGTIVRNVLDDFIWELRNERGYAKVEIPHLAKKDLYQKSGHWDKFKDELFHVTTREGREFVIKPMNCPHHTQIFNRKPHSYRDMPQRYANSTMVYRDEQSGELSGLSRVRCITQDDSHVFCRKDQVKDEIFAIWDMVDAFYHTFGFTLQPRLSLSDPDNMGAYLGDKKYWTEAENALRDLAKERGVGPIEQIGEAAFYGPKVDFVAKDSLGREWQVATIQLDMNMPERFNLSCVNEKGEDERIVMIHCAIMGSIERFMSVLIEHTAGNFPAWLAPIQIMLMPVSNEKHLAHTRQKAQELLQHGVRAAVDDSNESISKKVRNAEQQKIPFIIVIGDTEMSSDRFAVRRRGQRETVAMASDELSAALKRI